MLDRLDKMNSLVCHSPPLKVWSARGEGEVRNRLEVELTARRALSYLSGEAMARSYHNRIINYLVMFIRHTGVLVHNTHTQ